jgi:hypothetical protein
MCDIIRSQFDHSHPDSSDVYMRYLGRYATFHALHRIALIVDQAQARGWHSQARAVRYDDVGLHPDTGIRMCDRATDLALLDPLTEPLLPLMQSLKAA